MPSSQFRTNHTCSVAVAIAWKQDGARLLHCLLIEAVEKEEALVIAGGSPDATATSTTTAAAMVVATCVVEHGSSTVVDDGRRVPTSVPLH